MFLIAATILLTLKQQPAPGFVRIPAGSYQVGKAGRLENLPRVITLKAFEISRTETTNEEFQKFVAATGYVTDAERLHNAMVFEPGLKEFRWIQDPTATWKFPNGRSRGDLKGKGRHPVTTISVRDAGAYCTWAKVRLPTLDEWEVACRAGTKTDHFFGTDLAKIRLYANIWHGRNHMKADASDGFMLTAPVGSFRANPIGLYDMYGNVFEFCDGYLPSDMSTEIGHSRGGSWWCSKNSCSFFNSVDIGKVNIRASFSNQGFRVARDSG